MGTSIYHEDLIGRDWLDFRRVLRREPVIALDYLIDELMTRHKPLDWEKVTSSPVTLYAVATRLPEYEAETIGPLRLA